MAKVSVIVPNYNHARFLRERIDTILGQTYQDFELILLDDCSSDDSRSILSSYASDPRVRIDFNETNSGNTFKQWNKGVRRARGEYVWFAESDDYADPRLLERLVAALDAEPEAAFAYCRSWRVDSQGRAHGYGDYYVDYLQSGRWANDYTVTGADECSHYFLFNNVVPNASAVVFRRHIYEQVGGADESLRLCGDWKLWAAMALTGRIVYLAEALNYFRFHEASVTTQSQRVQADLAEAIAVSNWILQRVKPEKAVLQKLYKTQAQNWVPVMMSLATSRQTKTDISRQVRALDPHPLRHAIRPGITALRRAVARRLRDLRENT